MVNRESKKKIPGALLVGVGVGLCVSVLVAMLGAGLIAGEKLQESATGLVAMFSLFSGAMTASLLAAGKMKAFRFPVCLAAGLAYLVGLMIVSVVLFDGVKDGLIASAAVVLGGVLTAFLSGMGRQHKPKFKHAKLRK